MCVCGCNYLQMWIIKDEMMCYFTVVLCGSFQGQAWNRSAAVPASTTSAYPDCCLLFQGLTLYLNEPIMLQNVF